MILLRIVSILKQHSYKLNTRPYELNIVGIRADSTRPNRFDDEIHVFYKTTGAKWNYHVFKATTDPGTFWLKNPMNQQGTAILAQGQYVNAYSIGLHRGKYKALVQSRPVTVIRDYDRDNVLDFYNGKKQTGSFGINIHRASIQGTTKYVDEYSAGCQVFSDIKEFAFFMELCEYHRKLYGNSFTYTLLDFRAMKRETVRRVGIAVVLAGLVTAGWAGLRNRFKHKK